MSILAYHFVGDTLRDGRPVPPDGEWLVHEGPIEICVSGLHASRHPFDALQYAPGNTLCLVEIEGDIFEQDNKLVGRRRRIVKRIDAEPLMREFARWCALQVIELWDAPEVVRQYLTTGDGSLRGAAWAAAWATASAAASAASATAWAAASATASAAASAASATAWGAAWAAASAAASAASAARAAASAASATASATAWAAASAAASAASATASAASAAASAASAARAAASAAQRDRFRQMVDAAFEVAP